MYRQQNPAVLDTAFVTFRLILRNAHAHQSAQETANRSPDTKTCQCAHDRTRRDQRTHTRDSQSTNAGEQSQCSPDRSAHAYTGGSAFRSFRVLFGCKIPRSLAGRP